jgi:RHS repeat-associated protein
MNTPRLRKRALRTLICAVSLFTAATHAQPISTPPSSVGGTGGASIGELLGTPAASGAGVSAGGGGAMCSAPLGGATCGGAGPASQGNTSGVNTGAGNPINLTNGNKFLTEVDLPALPGELGLEIVRHYNSAHRHVLGQLGVGWRLSYETDLYVIGRTVQILQADGARLVFNIDPHNPSHCAGADPIQGWVQILTRDSGKKEYLWHWTHGEHAGRRLRFDERGKLVQIIATSGAVLSIEHSPKGQLLKVTDPQGRTLSFNHSGLARVRQAKAAHQKQREQQRQASGTQDLVGSAGAIAVFTGIQSIDSPVGRFTYGHGVPTLSPTPTGASGSTPEALALARAQAANLVQVGLPTHVDTSQRAHAHANRPVSSSTLRRQYHYEDPRHPQALTGISVVGSGSDDQVIQQRLATYQYNERAQATLSVRGEAHSTTERVQVQILQPSLQSHRAGNNGNKPGGNPSGQTLLTNSLGQQTLYTHQIIDGQYRLLQAVGAGCSQCGPVNLRWGYDARGRLIEQTALSPVAVVNGQPQGTPQPLLTTRHTLDAQGRTERIEQIAHVNGKAQAPRMAERHEHTDTRWPTKPTLIARPSVVPGQEHRIALSYNEAGQVVEFLETGWSPLDAQGEPARTPAQATPLERSTRYTHTRINGRSLLTRVDGPLPNGPGASAADSDITELEWDEKGRFIQTVRSPGGLRNDITLDAATGLVERVLNDAGFATHFTHNPQGQPTRISSQGPGWARPQVHSVHHDALGNPVERFEGDATAHGKDSAYKPRPMERQGFDAQGRMLWHASALGLLQTWQYNTEGQVLQSARRSSTMAQVATRTYDDLGRPNGLSDNAADQPGRGRSQRPQAFIDDFGRTVLTRSPDRGDILRGFDEADRLIRMTDAMGHRAEYAHDVQGRILRQRITDARTGEIGTTEWRYNTRHLLEVIHPTQRERFEVDARGLRTARIVTVVTPQGELTSVTRYEHDETGRLIATTLPDGSRLLYERNGQQQVVALKRQTIQTPWLRWLGREQTLASGFERDLLGLRSFTSGNGIEARWQRSARGDLARLVHRHTAGRPAPAPVLLGRTTQETIERLLGIAPAHAQASPVAPAGTAPRTDQAGAEPPHTQPGALGLPPDPQALIDHRYLWSPGGLLLHSQQRAGSQSEQHQHSHAYNGRGQLVASVRSGVGEGEGEQSVWRYAYDAQQRRVLSQQGISEQSDLGTGTVRSQFKEDNHRLHLNAQPTNHPTIYNSNGQPERLGQREYVWDALGRLMEVREEARPIATYRYDHRGLRIAKQVGAQTTLTLYDESHQPLAELGEQGRITRQFVWLADLPLVVIDAPADAPRGLASAEPAVGMGGGVTQVLSDLAAVVQSWLNPHQGITWLHTNHLGAPEAATNARGEVVWRARYAPFGAAQINSGRPEPRSVRPEPVEGLTHTAFTLHLRLPGQVWDAETGLHYNRQRYYDPHLGQYLSPDPLGTPDGPNPYAYVAFNPLTYIDPDGLILFAFDGTGNDDPPMEGSAVSNVVRFRDIYNDGAARYVSGVGTVHEDAAWGAINVPPLDAAINGSGTRRIERMMTYLLEEARAADDNTRLNIDIVGFSRGAAQARDFANNIIRYSGTSVTGDTYNFQTDARGWFTYTASVRNAAGQSVRFEGRQCVNLRFMGLWDTVLSTNSGRGYRLGIPPHFQHVAHAVALNEYRSQPSATWDSLSNRNFYSRTRIQLDGSRHWGGFPLVSIGASSSRLGQVRIERGFIGAHADIGGGYGANDDGLSSVALSWMVGQAQIAGVAMNQPRAIDMNNPVIHDQSNVIRFGDPRRAPATFEVTGFTGGLLGNSTYRTEDRMVSGAPSGSTQRTMGFGAPEAGGNRSMTNTETHEFIRYDPRPANILEDTRNTDTIYPDNNTGSRNRTGTVDMQGYMSWLRQHGYVFAGDY